MNVEDLLVEVRDSSLNRVGQITADYLVGATFVPRFNQIGSWTIKLPIGHPLASAITAPGAGIIVTYLGTVLLSGPMTWSQTVQTADNPDGDIEVTGLDDSVLLRDRLAYPTPTTATVTSQTSAYDVRTGAAEDVIKGYVTANMGADAPAVRKIASLTVEPSYARGSSVKGSARFDVLYELLTALADASASGGMAIGFEVQQVSNGLVFSVYVPIDRSKTVRLDIANNQLSETIYSLSQPKFTRAIVGGQGDLTARTFLERTSSTSLSAETAWGRRIEQFVDSRDSSDSVALQTAGDSLLATDGKPQISASVRPTDDQSMLFGLDWFLGDTVTVVVGTYELSAVATEMAISVESDGVRLYGTVGEPKLQTYEQQILTRQANLATRMNNLERFK